MYVWVPSLSPETTTTLLIGYTPIENKKLKKNYNNRVWAYFGDTVVSVSDDHNKVNIAIKQVAWTFCFPVYIKVTFIEYYGLLCIQKYCI